MAQSTVICEICDKREYEQICIDCDQYFCQECKEGHIKTKTTKDHTFHYSATFQPQYKKLRCRKHEQHFIFFCERCQTLVCPICLPENHQEHRMLKIDEVASIKKKELNQTIESFVTKLNEFEADVNRLQNITKKCTGENKDVIQHVDRQAKHISNVLENQRRCIIDDIKQKAKTETERISTIEGDLQHCLKAAKEMERKAKLYIHGSDTSLLSNFQLIKSEVDTFELQDTSISTCSVQFSKYNVPKEELSLLESVFSGNLCGLSENVERNTLKNMMSNHDGKIKELQKELTNRIHIRQQSFSNQLNEKDNKISDLNRMVNNQNRILLEKEEAIRFMKTEKDYLQARLNSVAGEKLKKGNVSITDDPIRPMKIGERYGELYDNEWTDEMENIINVKKYYPDMKDNEKEEIIIRHLQRILRCCYGECLRKAEDQIQTLGKALEETMCLTFESKEEIESLHVFKEAGVLRRTKSEDFAKILVQNKVICNNTIDDWDYINKNGNVMRILLKSSFFKQCVYLCWCMVIQDPVMYLDDDPIPCTPIDKNTYKEFVKSGDSVAYVVWPALFLHKDGPLLYKGIVQAYWKEDDDDIYRSEF